MVGRCSAPSFLLHTRLRSLARPLCLYHFRMQSGTRLGPYELIAPLGAGGMGEVWRARDERLHRDVAIKVMLDAKAQSESALARFEREARAVAALSHPNILAIHDFGHDAGILYAVMELLEGATLRVRLAQSELALSRALDWGHQIAQGLAAAHERGIIHRDLKPENIFVTRDGVVKILDFGLARLEGGNHGLIRHDAETLAVTSPGAIVGTVVYLSPEVARGETADARSDIFAFGAVFYEMLTGQFAFLRGSTAETLVAILREEPKSAAECGRKLPGEVEEILQHCLEKQPDERFRSARDLAFALKLATRTSSAPPAETPRKTPRPLDSPQPSATRALSIAVLPFRNMSPAGDTEYFSDGMTEEIIHSLSAVSGLRVAARSSSFAFKGRNDDVRQIGRELGVTMALEGSVRQSGTRLRVTAQLVNVEDGYDLWSNRWDRELSDIFAVQDEIAEAIASTLKLRLAEATPTGGAARTQVVAAYDRYLRGRYLWGQRRAAEAIAEQEAAVEIDPDFVDAHTALADAWAVRGFYGGVPTWEAWSRARAALDEAVRISPDAPGVAISSGILEHYYGWDTTRQERFCRQAIERDPQSADGWNWLSVCLGASGRTSEALEAGERGIRFEPHHVNVRTSRSWAYIYVGDFDSARRDLEEAVAIDSNAGYALWSYGYALKCLGRLDEAVAIFERLVNASGRAVPFYLSLLGGALGAAGETSKARGVLNELEERRHRNEFVASIDIATVLVDLGELEPAIDALERARDERNAFLWGRIYFPHFAPLRANPRWRALVRRVSRAAPSTVVSI